MHLEIFEDQRTSNWVAILRWDAGRPLTTLFSIERDDVHEQAKKWMLGYTGHSKFLSVKEWSK